MATTTPANPTVNSSKLTWWIAFIQAHEKLILVGAASLLLWHFGDKVVSAYEAAHKSQQSADNQQIAQLHQDNVTLAQTLAQMQANYTSQIANLNAKIAAKQNATVIQQKTDAALPLPDLSARWESLLVLSPGSITPQPNGTVAVTTDAAHSTVNELEKVPQLMEQVLDTQTELKSCTDLSAQKDKTIQGAQAELAAEKKGRADDKAVAKDNQRKSFWKGTKIGAAVATGAIFVLKIALIVK